MSGDCAICLPPCRNRAIASVVMQAPLAKNKNSPRYLSQNDFGCCGDRERQDGHFGQRTDPFAIAVTSAAVYVVSQAAGTVTVIDPGSLKMTANITVGDSPYGIAVAS